MYLLSLQTALPPKFFPQEASWEAFRESATARRLRGRSVSLVEKLLRRNNGIDGRHFALLPLEDIFERDAESLNRGFEAVAPPLGARALAAALDSAGLAAGDVDALIVCTCTGYLCPGLSSFIAEQAGLRGDAGLFDLAGLGCGAAIPSLRLAAGLAAADPEARIGVIALEVCSAAFYMDDDPGVLISACLFGDGAAAVIVSGTPGQGAAWQFSGFRSLHLPENRQDLRFENSGGKLRNRLHRSVPQTAAAAVKTLEAGFRASNPGRNPRYITHGGGKDVLDALEPVVGQALPEARAVLREAGNMSSPSVLFALRRYLDGEAGADDLRLISFGAGFSAHACSLRRGGA
ncbi:MAG: stilbene synthase [Opitutales bacterium]|nr:stilbene synthase [Opitutales bacterium]